MTALSTDRHRSPASSRRSPNKQQAAPQRPALGVTRRRWGRVGAGTAMVMLGAWVFTGLYLSAGDRREVLVMAQDIKAHEVVERDDVRAVRVSVDRGVGVVAAEDLDRVVGRPARTALVAGSLLSEAQLAEQGDDGLDAGEAVVSMVLAPGEAPTAALEPDAPVAVVLRAPAGQEGDLTQVRGQVLGVSGSDQGASTVELVIADDDAATVSAAAAEDRVTLIALAGDS